MIFEFFSPCLFLLTEQDFKFLTTSHTIPCPKTLQVTYISVPGNLNTYYCLKPWSILHTIVNPWTLALKTIHLKVFQRVLLKCSQLKKV